MENLNITSLLGNSAADKKFILHEKHKFIHQNILRVLTNFEEGVYNQFRQGNISEEQKEFSGESILNCIDFLEGMIRKVKRELQDDKN